jgi:hypothetical protein
VTGRLVPSTRAEAATTELMATLAAHQIWRRTRVVPFVRLGLPGRAGPAPRDVDHLTIPHFAAVGEEFARAALLEASEPLVPQTNEILRLMWLRAESQAEQWSGLEEAWVKWHGVNIRSEPTYEIFRAVVDARNAIVHGLGHLTRKQTRGDGGAAVRLSLSRIGITTSGTLLIITDDVVKQSVQAARDFILWLDRESVTKRLRPLTSPI